MGKKLIKYKEIANAIRSRIEQGIYPVGKALPKQSDLAKEFYTSRMTIQKALNLLNIMGFTYSIQGAGSFVKNNALTVSKLDLTVDQYAGTTAVYKDKAAVTSQIISFDIRLANQLEMKKLGIDEYQSVYEIHRLRFLDGAPASIEHTIMPTAVIPGINKEILLHSIYGYIAHELHHNIGAAYREISADKPDASDKKYLNCTETDPVIQVLQTAYLDDGTPFELSVVRHRYDMGKIIYIHPDHPMTF